MGERGSVTIWLLGMSVVILFVAGFSVDLWQATAQRRALAGLADAAATAGSAALDEAAFRRTGEVRLDPERATALATELLAVRRDDAGLPVTDAAVDATAEQIDVTVLGEVDVTLLRLLRPGVDVWDVRVRAVAEPEVPAGP